MSLEYNPEHPDVDLLKEFRAFSEGEREVLLRLAHAVEASGHPEQVSLDIDVDAIWATIAQHIGDAPANGLQPSSETPE